MSRVSFTCVALLAAISGGLSASSAAHAQSIEEKAAICATCHGEKGIPISKEIPIIWGQMEGYIYLQLRDFKKGARASEVMGPIASTLERQDMFDLAAFFAAKSWPNLNQPVAPESVAAVARTANSSVGCTGCHLDAYQGTGTAPRLAGQSHDYLAAQLAAFRSGARANNPGMTSLMKATSEADLAALADYLAGLYTASAKAEGAEVH